MGASCDFVNQTTDARILQLGILNPRVLPIGTNRIVSEGAESSSVKQLAEPYVSNFGYTPRPLVSKNLVEFGQLPNSYRVLTAIPWN